MGKRVESPVKKFPGFVVFRDPLPYYTVLKLERTMRELVQDEDVGEKLLPVIIESVETWELEGLTSPTLETFPGSPRVSIHRLIAWLLGEITAIYKGNEDDDPKK